MHTTSVIIASVVLIFLLYLVFSGKFKKPQNETYSKYESKDLNYLIERINVFLKDFAEEDKITRETFLSKIKELEESNSYEYTAELNEYIDIYNKIIAKFDKYYVHYSNEENQKKDNSEDFLEEYIEKLDHLHEKIKKLRLKISRITFVKIEEEKTNEKEYNEQPEYKEEIKSSYIFFSGTETKSELKVKYKSLVKIYHPDSVTGDTVKFQILQKEYEELNSLTK